MSTLVARLAGPLQSYGENTRFSSRGTLPYPTYSALIGLARAALGHGRDSDPTEISWLRDLSMAIRIDCAGSMILDYHTINPPNTSKYAWLRDVDQKKLNTHTVPTATGGVWRIASNVPSMVTRRTYLSDAAFMWFIEGKSSNIKRLHKALENPRWQLSLGRKACVPDWPLALGVTDKPIMDAAKYVPAVHGAGTWKLHVLAGPILVDASTIHCLDEPLGSHPHDGYARRARQVSTVEPVAVPNRSELLKWAKENLS